MSHLWILSAASGTGKTSLVKKLLSEDAQVQVSVSHTTRKPRDGEVNGYDYHFVTHDQFKHLIEQGEFVEYAEVFGNYYGTSKSEVNSKIKAGFDVILEIDWQGALQIQKIQPHAKSIFIFPPSYEQLRLRLESRGKDDQAVIERRLNEAKLEISKSSHFDYWLINDHFDEALATLKSIIKAHRFEKAIMEQRYPDLVRGICGSQD